MVISRPASLTFVLGLIAGGLLVFVLKPSPEASRAGKPAMAEETSPTSMPGRELEAMSDRIVELERENRELRARRDAEEATERAREEARRKLSEGAESFLGAQMQKRVEGRLLSLRDRLTLTPDQEQQLRAFLEAESRQLIERRLARKRGERWKAPERMQTFEGLLAQVLSGEQLEAYERYQDDRRHAELETTAARELERLQGLMELSEEQKDQAYAVFYELASGSAGWNAQLNEAGELEMDMGSERELMALSEVLTPEQLALYAEQQQLDRNFSEAILQRFDIKAH